MNDFGSIFGLFAIIPILIYLLILGFTIYFIVRVIKFMNEKTKLDQQRNDKLDSLIKAISESKGN
jgi:large-conductance mechanosensitive channel